MEWLIILCAGTSVGLAAGLFGVGGSFLLVPLLSITTSTPMELLVGSCACQVLGPATAASLSYRIRLRDLQIPLIILGGIVAGTFLGSVGLQRLSQSADPENVTFVVQLGYVLLLWSLGLFSWWEAWRHRVARPIPIGWFTVPRLKPVCEVFGRQRIHAISIISLSIYGIGVGLLSGFLGLSGGVVLVPGLHYFYGIPTKRAARLSMILVGLIAIQATCIHASYGRIDLFTVVLLLLGGTIGAQLGVHLAERMTGGDLRKQFAWLLMLSAIGLSVYFFSFG